MRLPVHLSRGWLGFRFWFLVLFRSIIGGSMHATSTAQRERKPTSHVYYSMTKSLCGTCKLAVDAKIIFRDGKVWFDKFCPDHGHEECLAASSVEWYLDALSFVAPNTPPKRISKPVSAGCPFDCGACPSHQQKVYLPVIPITSSCNLDCPICYTINKNDDAHNMSVDDMAAILGHLAEDHEEIDIINFTGGEPTLHPQLLDFLQMCRDAGIRRLTISTNGLKLRDEAYVRKLAALDARIVLSLDTFRPETDRILLGANTVKAKLDALDLLEKHDVATTILPAVATGLNDDEVGDLLQLVLTRPHIRSLELHTLTFTGQGGVGFQRSARITIPDLHRRIILYLRRRSGRHLHWQPRRRCRRGSLRRICDVRRGRRGQGARRLWHPDDLRPGRSPLPGVRGGLRDRALQPRVRICEHLPILSRRRAGRAAVHHSPPNRHSRCASPGQARRSYHRGKDRATR
jgi:MoaA/NifB/PqqE/SkfB family radical SAM enzyme